MDIDSFGRNVMDLSWRQIHDVTVTVYFHFTAWINVYYQSINIDYFQVSFNIPFDFLFHYERFYESGTHNFNKFDRLDSSYIFRDNVLNSQPHQCHNLTDQGAFQGALGTIYPGIAMRRECLCIFFLIFFLASIYWAKAFVMCLNNLLRPQIKKIEIYTKLFDQI